MKTYKPALDPVLMEKIKKKHQKVFRLISKHKKHYNLLGFKIDVQKNAFPPCPDSIIFAQFLSKIKKVGSSLDMGTGSGILALVLSKKSRNVLAVDINPHALRSIRDNVKTNKIKNIQVRQSNIFSNINEKFDLIVFNAPFRFFKPKNMLDRAMTDHNYKNLASFFENAKKHLNKNGKIFLIFSNSGDLAHLEKLIKENGFSFKISKKVYSQCLGWDIKELKNYYVIYKIK